MAKRRWQPPPMNTPSDQGSKDQGVKLDEQVVRRVLKVNPDLRDGRTTLQVKKALERGETLQGGSDQASPGNRARPTSAAAPSAVARPTSDSGRQLAETLDFFMTSKGRELGGELEELAARRRTLDEEEKNLRADVRRKLVDFLAMLDPGVLAIHGKEALSPHRELLAKVGLNASELLAAVKRGQR